MDRSALPLAAALLAFALPAAFAEQLLKSGSFESPRVKDRIPLEKGGTPVLGGDTDWAIFLHPRIGEQGILSAGLTPELARSGRQSIYLEFEKFSAPQQGVVLESNLISILPAKTYRVGIWGRMPKKGALTIDQRLVYLKLFVEFFLADQETQTGDPAEGVRIQPIPGSPNRPPFFTSGRWSEYFAEIAAPADASFMKTTWKWETPPSAGTTSGTILFDDATIEGEPGPVPPEDREPTEDEEMDEKATPAKSDPPAATQPKAAVRHEPARQPK